MKVETSNNYHQLSWTFERGFKKAVASTCLHSFRNKKNLSFLLISTMQEMVWTRVSHLIMLSDRASEG